MIPSLVVGEVSGALGAPDDRARIGDEDARQTLTGLLTDPGRGIFRGPYLCAGTSYQPVPNGWASPFGWLPGESGRVSVTRGGRDLLASA